MEKNKKVYLVELVSVLVLFLVICGSAFAYISIYLNVESRSINKVESATEDGIITFLTDNNKMNIIISGSDMNPDNIGTKYYATPNDGQNYVLEDEVHDFKLATINLSGTDKKYECNYRFKVYLDSTSTMVPSKLGEVVLSFSGDTEFTESNIVDVKELKEEFVKYISGKFTLNGEESKSIYMQMYIKNTEYDQTVGISGEKLNIKIDPNGINRFNDLIECNLVE